MKIRLTDALVVVRVGKRKVWGYCEVMDDTGWQDMDLDKKEAVDKEPIWKVLNFSSSLSLSSLELSDTQVYET